MKTLLTIFFLSITISISAQGEYTELEQEVDKKAKTLREVLEAQDYYSDFEKINTVSFKVDTFIVEEILSGKLDIDFTTIGMIEAMYDAEKKYDKLLNKYYKILMDMLEEEDKETLRTSQRNWITFRDSEKNVAAMLTQEHYTGGGTMHNITLAYENMMITKRRVIELYNHICRFYEYGY